MRVEGQPGDLNLGAVTSQSQPVYQLQKKAMLEQQAANDQWLADQFGTVYPTQSGIVAAIGFTDNLRRRGLSPKAFSEYYDITTETIPAKPAYIQYVPVRGKPPRQVKIPAQSAREVLHYKPKDAYLAAALKGSFEKMQDANDGKQVFSIVAYTAPPPATTHQVGKAKAVPLYVPPAAYARLAATNGVLGAGDPFLEKFYGFLVWLHSRGEYNYTENGKLVFPRDQNTFNSIYNFMNAQVEQGAWSLTKSFVGDVLKAVVFAAAVIVVGTYAFSFIAAGTSGGGAAAGAGAEAGAGTTAATTATTATATTTTGGGILGTGVTTEQAATALKEAYAAVQAYKSYKAGQAGKEAAKVKAEQAQATAQKLQQALQQQQAAQAALDKAKAAQVASQTPAWVKVALTALPFIALL